MWRRSTRSTWALRLALRRLFRSTIGADFTTGPAGALGYDHRRALRV